MPRPVFKTGLAGIMLAGEFDSLPSPPMRPTEQRFLVFIQILRQLCGQFPSNGDWIQ